MTGRRRRRLEDQQLIDACTYCGYCGTKSPGHKPTCCNPKNTHRERTMS